MIDSNIEPFVGLIVRPPSRKTGFLYDHTWFHIRREPANSEMYKKLVRMGYGGITLEDDALNNTNEGTFCMRLHASVRIRRGSLADNFFKRVSHRIYTVNNPAQ